MSGPVWPQLGLWVVLSIRGFWKAGPLSLDARLGQGGSRAWGSSVGYYRYQHLPSYHLLSAHCVPGTALSIFYVLSNLKNHDFF